MAVHKLIPYWIKVREVEEPDSAWDQTSIHTNEPAFPEDNLADYFHDFVSEYQESGDVYVDEEEQETFTVAPPVKREGNTVEGRFKSGEYGRNADFWDIDQHERIEDAREENHAEEIPYYFLFHIPDEDRSQALLILSKYKTKGVKTTFKSQFDVNTRDIDVGDAYMTIKPHYSDEVIDKIETADEVACVRFRGTETVPAREKYADRNHIERTRDEISGQLNLGAELKLTPKGNQSGFREFLKGLVSDTSAAHFKYGQIEDQDFSNASVTVVEGESDLTFSLWKKQIQMRMDLDPEEDDIDVYGGHPTPHSLGCVARQLANDLMDTENTDLPTKSLIPKTVGAPDESDEQEAVQRD